MSLPSTILRHLHSIGVDHSHGLFDNDTNSSSSASNLADAAASDIDLAMETENDRSRTVYMSIFFSVNIVIYIALCALYHRKKLVQSVHNHSLSPNELTRDQLRSTNRAVLDESSSVANGARMNANMLLKLEERKVKIQSVLVTRLVVEQDFNNEEVKEVVGDVAVENVQSNLVEGRSSTVENKSLEEGCMSNNEIPPVVTQSTSGETSESSNDNSSTAPNSPPPARATALTAASSFSCMDLKKYTHAINNYCLNDNNNSSNQGVVTNNTHAMLLNHEECNICFSAFQVGDRIAWSHKNVHDKEVHTKSPQGAVAADCEQRNKDSMICRHVFHAECIKRWLLVREGCPVCRRSYFEDESRVDGSDGIVEENNDVIDLERGGGSDNVSSHDVILAEESLNIRRVSGIVVVEE